MKILMKPIKMISITNEQDQITPLKFQMINENKELITVKIDNITLKSEEKLSGNKMLIYRCQSQIGDNIKVYELKFEIMTCIWYLWKI